MNARAEYPIQTLWVGDTFSQIERLSLSSFVKCGHTVHLYTYGPIKNVPAGVKILDANEILPQKSIVKYEFGFKQQLKWYLSMLKNFRVFSQHRNVGIQFFANTFRYKMLYLKGGWWVDTDIVCLKKFNFDEEYVFAEEHNKVEGIITVNNGVIKVPPKSELMRRLYEESAKISVAEGGKVKWGTTGPLLLTKLVKELKLESFNKKPEVFNPIPWFKGEEIVKADTVVPESYSIHLWNEFWRFSGLDKNASYPPTSIVEQLKKRYLD